jgi:hypothetical protein
MCLVIAAGAGETQQGRFCRSADTELAAYVRQCHSHQARITFNVGIYQDGTLAPASIKQLRRLAIALHG